MDECVVDNHPQYAVKFSKMGYRKDGNITNIPLYLVGKTKELLEGEREIWSEYRNGFVTDIKEKL